MQINLGLGASLNVCLDSHAIDRPSHDVDQPKAGFVGETLRVEFMEPMGLKQSKLAIAPMLPRKHINELCNDRRAVTADPALILARVFWN